MNMGVIRKKRYLWAEKQRGLRGPKAQCLVVAPAGSPSGRSRSNIRSRSRTGGGAPCRLLFPCCRQRLLSALGASRCMPLTVCSMCAVKPRRTSTHCDSNSSVNSQHFSHSSCCRPPSSCNAGRTLAPRAWRLTVPLVFNQRALFGYMHSPGQAATSSKISGAAHAVKRTGDLRMPRTPPVRAARPCGDKQVQKVWACWGEAGRFFDGLWWSSVPLQHAAGQPVQRQRPAPLLQPA